MRLLFVSHSVPPADQLLSNLGGMQRVAADLYGALERHPDVALDSLLLRTSWRWTHVLTGPFLARLLWDIPRLVRQHRIDVVLYSSMVTAAVTPPLRRRLHSLGVRTAAIAHGRDVTLPNPGYQRLVPHVFSALDQVLPVSRATGEACMQRGLRPEKCRVVPNGINVDRFEAPIDREEARGKLAAEGFTVPDSAFLLCSVGRQVERKGFKWFIDRVMPILPDDVHYWLGGEGPETERLRAVISDRGLHQRVRLLGRVTDEQLRLLYMGSDLFIMPNIPIPGDMEGFGVVMLEAGLCGLAAVAANLEGVRDVIAEGENGHLVESGNAEAFAEVIRTYHADLDLVRRDGARAREYVLEQFNWSRVADQYVQVLRDLL